MDADITHIGMGKLFQLSLTIREGVPLLREGQLLKPEKIGITLMQKLLGPT